MTNGGWVFTHPPLALETPEGLHILTGRLSGYFVRDSTIIFSWLIHFTIRPNRMNAARIAASFSGVSSEA